MANGDNSNAPLSSAPDAGPPALPPPSLPNMQGPPAQQAAAAPQAAPAPDDSANLQAAYSQLFPQSQPQTQPPQTTPYNHTVIQGIMDALAPQTQYVVGPDGKMQSIQVPNTPGSFAKRVIAGALSGFARAGAVQPGPGYAARAAAAGAGGGLQMAQQQGEQGRAQATEDYERQQQATMQRAQRVMMAQNYMTQQLQYIHGKFQHQQEISNANNATEALIDDQKMQRKGIVKSHAELMTKVQADPELAKLWAQNRIFQAPHYDDNGNQDGITLAVRQPGRRPLENDLKIPYPTSKTEPGTDKPIFDERTLPAGMDEEDAMASATAAASTKNQMLDAWQKTQTAKLEAEARVRNEQREERLTDAQVQAAHSEAALHDAQAKYLTNPATQGPDSLGFTPTTGMPAKEYEKREDAYKKNTDHLISTEQRYREFQDGLTAIKNGDWTGGRSVAALFNAIGLSTVNDKGGMRVTKNIISEHEHARGWLGELQNHLESIKNGQVITAQQLADYGNVASEMRANEYIATANMVHNAGLRADFILPNGNGQKLDPSTAKIFMTLGNGDWQKATAAAREHGWDVTAPQQQTGK